MVLGAPRWNAAWLGPAGSRRAALEVAFAGQVGERVRIRVRLGASLAPALATICPKPEARDHQLAICAKFQVSPSDALDPDAISNWQLIAYLHELLFEDDHLDMRRFH